MHRGSALLVTMALALACAGRAAEAAPMTGTVVDASGAPVPGATVTVIVQGKELQATTDGGGLFELPEVPDGDAVLRATAPGFAEAVVERPAATGLRIVLQPARFVDTVTVTASRGDERLATAAATTVLTSAELLNSPPGTLDDALRNTPGFSLFRRSSSRVANPTTQGVTLRGVSGSGASRTMVLADGLPLNDAFGSWVYWNRVPQAAIERVEVVRGATGDLYGADALGGVVQVLTFSPGPPRMRASIEGGSHDTWRGSVYGGGQLRGWHGSAAGEFVRTDGVLTIAPEVRGAVDTEADSDYGTGFVAGGYDAGAWHANARFSQYDENRGNGTPLQVNTTEWRQFSGDAAGTAGGGAWQARAGGGTQSYYQTFTTITADRSSERLITEQTTPTTFSNFSGQWTRGWGERVLMVGGEGKYTKSTVEELRYAVSGAVTGPFLAGGTEKAGAIFGRLALVPLDRVTVVLGARTDFWNTNPTGAALPANSSVFFSPRASAAYRWSEWLSAQASVYRSYRSPTLNELHRGFRAGNTVGNPNPLLEPESLTGFEGGVLLTHGVGSSRVDLQACKLEYSIVSPK